MMPDCRGWRRAIRLPLRGKSRSQTPRLRCRVLIPYFHRGKVAPTGIQETGSTFAFVVQGNYGFTSDGSSITIHWDGTNGSSLLSIRRADDSNYSITAGSMRIGGLTSGVRYGFASFVSIAQPEHLSFVQGDAGTPEFAFSHIRLIKN